MFENSRCKKIYVSESCVVRVQPETHWHVGGTLNTCKMHICVRSSEIANLLRILFVAFVLRKGSLFMFEDEAAYKFLFKKKLWPFSELDPIQVSDLDSNPGPGPKLTSGQIRGFSRSFAHFLFPKVKLFAIFGDIRLFGC